MQCSFVNELYVILVVVFRGSVFECLGQSSSLNFTFPAIVLITYAFLSVILMNNSELV